MFKKAKLFFILILPLLIVSCYSYRYAYRLIDPEDVVISVSELEESGNDLIDYFPKKYFKVMGVITIKEKMLLFHKRRDVLIKPDGKIYAYDLDDEPISVHLKDVKYFYLKRSLPSNEMEQRDP